LADHTDAVLNLDNHNDRSSRIVYSLPEYLSKSPLLSLEHITLEILKGLLLAPVTTLPRLPLSKKHIYGFLKILFSFLTIISGVEL